jgi:hypothetical protein
VTLVLRRAVQAWGLLLAIAASALVATAAVTLLAGYDRQVSEAGWQSIAASAPAADRSLLITGSVDGAAAAYAERDAAVRAHFAGGLGGVPVTLASARYGTGRQLPAGLGPVRATGDPVFANLASLAGLPAHADLVAGSWPRTGGDPLQVALPERVAATLGVTVGSRIAVRDRAAGRDSRIVVAGVWRPRDSLDPYWLLSPELATGSATSFGPFVVDAADFDTTFAGTATSVRWVVRPALTTAGLAGVAAARAAVGPAVRDLPAATGLGSSAVVTTGLDRLADRIARADAVGRSAMMIPLALTVILGVCVLVRVAALLNEDRQAQTTLLRARGASRRQLTGLAAGEAALTVAPAALLAPVPALLVLSRLDLHPRLDLVLWLVAAAVAVGCLVAMLVPAALAPDTPLGGRARPRRWAPAQRAGVDALLVAAAVLAWTQARQYSATVAGSGTRLLIDPSLAAAPVLGVVAGAAVALRVLPVLTGYVQRWVDRPRWPAATFGAWQAGRRPHTAPMLMLALAVGTGTLAWSLLATVDRSHAAQAAYEVGADLRLRDAAGSVQRAAQLAALPGVRSVAPEWRDDLRIGSDDTQVTVVAAAGVRPRGQRSGVALPADARRLAGVVRSAVPGARVTGLVTTADGRTYRVPLSTGPAGFSAGLPDGGELRLAGFDADAGRPAAGFDIAVTELRAARADGTAEAVDLRGSAWSALADQDRTTATAAAGELHASARTAAARFTLVAQPPDRPVPAVVTRELLRSLDAKVSDTVPLSLPGAELDIQVVGIETAVPGGGPGRATILLDLPAAADRVLFDTGTVRPYSEWRIGTDPRRHAEAAAAAGALPGVTVLDRVAVQRAADRDPYWRGVRTGLITAIACAVVLALAGYGVDMGIGLRRRAGDLAVLRRLGAGPGLLLRAFLLEQGMVAGAGALAGLAAGVLVSVLTVPLVIMTPDAARPVPAPELVLPWWPIGALTAGLPAAILVLSWAMAGRRRS